uniref:Uncharacterized protein n=1 Tax=Arundo donax TaxID=35708 RepID=A0A0A9FWN2_ARUDO
MYPCKTDAECKTDISQMKMINQDCTTTIAPICVPSLSG